MMLNEKVIEWTNPVVRRVYEFVLEHSITAQISFRNSCECLKCKSFNLLNLTKRPQWETIMGAMNSLSDYDLISKILSSMEKSKPVSLVTLSQRTGIRFIDLIRLCNVLGQDHLIEETRESSTKYYILVNDDYEDIIEKYKPEVRREPERPTALSGRDTILKRRAMRKLSSETNESIARPPEHRISNIPSARPNKPQSLSAIDLLAMKRSSAMNPRILNSARSASSVFPQISEQHDANGTPSTDNLRRMGAGTSSMSHKAVFINRPNSRSSRSSFGMLPPNGYEPTFERSDGVMKVRNTQIETKTMPLIPAREMGPGNNEISEAELREKLGLSPELPIIDILSKGNGKEIWPAYSALANTQGGFILIGVRKLILSRSGDSEVAGIPAGEKQSIYYIKPPRDPDDVIKQLLRDFNDRGNISECPPDADFIKTIELGRKKIIAIQVSLDTLSGNPVYTNRYSFSSHSEYGCYVYREGQIVHCNEQDVKALWERARLGAERPDWTQEGEMLPIQMSHKKEIALAPVFDETLRPLSHHVCNYGQPLRADLIPASERGYAARKERMTHRKLREEDNALGGRDELGGNASPTRQNAPSQETPSIKEVNVLDTATNASTETSVDSEVVILRKLLFAEDIRASKTKTSSSSENGKTTNESVQKAPESRDTTAIKVENATEIPPSFAEADRALLDSIAQPAITHPRFPVTRLCEIAVALCQQARFTPAEFAEILHRKMPTITDKLLPKLKENPKICEFNDAYYYRK